MNLLRMLIDSDNAIMVDNYRPLQALNGRTVYSSFNASTGTSATTPTTEMTTTVKAHATAVSITAALLLLMLVAAIFMH